MGLGVSGRFVLFGQAGAITNVGNTKFLDLIGTDAGLISGLTIGEVHTED